MRKREINTNLENFCPHVEAKTIGGTAINSMHQGVCTTHKPMSCAVNRACRGSALAHGNRSVALSTGLNSVATTFASSSLAIVKNDYSAACVTADNSLGLCLGNGCVAIAGGANSMALCLGKNNIAKGELGTWLIFTEYGEFDGEIYPLVNVKAVQVDGKNVKPNTFYTCENGELVEMAL